MKDSLQIFWDCITRKYFCSDGRASRSEYLIFHFYSFILIVGAFFSDVLIADFIEAISHIRLGFHFYLTVGICLFLSIPATTLEIRRWHDLGKSGWNFYSFFNLFDFLLLNKGTRGRNKYGPAPIESFSEKRAEENKEEMAEALDWLEKQEENEKT
ncbi:MAG: DUF805 domain-containing protein [Thermoguttaceae bacterium]